MRQPAGDRGKAKLRQHRAAGVGGGDPLGIGALGLAAPGQHHGDAAGGERARQPLPVGQRPALGRPGGAVQEQRVRRGEVWMGEAGAVETGIRGFVQVCRQGIAECGGEQPAGAGDRMFAAMRRYAKSSAAVLPSMIDAEQYFSADN